MFAGFSTACFYRLRLYAVSDCGVQTCPLTQNFERGRMLELPLKPLLTATLCSSDPSASFGELLPAFSTSKIGIFHDYSLKSFNHGKKLHSESHASKTKIHPTFPPNHMRRR
jgi:hypothetical protein